MRKFFIVLFCLCLTGCVAIFKPEKRLVSFESNPSGAIVYADNIPVGTTPVKVKLIDGQPIEIVMQKEGYAPVTETIQTHNDTFWVIMQNIPFPILGSAFASNFQNMSVFNKTEVKHDLEPI